MPRGWVVGDGDKGSVVVEAVVALVRAKLGRQNGPEERLLVIRTSDARPEVTYSMSKSPAEVPLTGGVALRSTRHRVEPVFQEAKGDVGLAHDEVRAIFTTLLGKRPLKSAEIAREISDVPWCNEEAPIDHWNAITKAFLPRHSTSGFGEVLQ